MSLPPFLKEKMNIQDNEAKKIVDKTDFHNKCIELLAEIKSFNEEKYTELSHLFHEKFNNLNTKKKVILGFYGQLVNELKSLKEQGETIINQGTTQIKKEINQKATKIKKEMKTTAKNLKTSATKKVTKVKNAVKAVAKKKVAKKKKTVKKKVAKKKTAKKSPVKKKTAKKVVKKAAKKKVTKKKAPARKK